MCGCNKKVSKIRPASAKRTILRKIWEKTKIEEKPLTVRKINNP